MILLKNIGTGIAATWIALTGFLGFNHGQIAQDSAPKVQESMNVGGFNPAGGLTYRLQTSVGTTDTTVRLSSFKDRAGTPLTLASNSINSSIGYGTLDPQNATRSEFISFTGVTQNSDGSAILTGVTRGLSDIYPFSASTTLRLSHAGQSIFILSDAPGLFTQYAVKSNNELIPGQWTASSTNPLAYDNQYNTTSSSTNKQIQTAGWTYTNFVRSNEDTTINATTTAGTGHGFVQALAPSNGSDVANKTYVDGVAVAGAPNASTVVKGIVEEATVPEISAGTAVGGTGARLYVNPNSFQYSTFASSSPAVFSTTTSVAIGTSTLQTIPSKNYLEVVAYGSTTPTTQLRLSFNGDNTATYSSEDRLDDPTTAISFVASGKYILLCNSGPNLTAGHEFTLIARIYNDAANPKQGEYTLSSGGTTAQGFDFVCHGTFRWNNTSSAISSISLSNTLSQTAFGTNLLMRVTGY